MNMLKNKKGFTLIEMLVVIAIIAVLVAIVIPVVGNSTAKARAATDAANLRSVMAEANVEMLANEDNNTGMVKYTKPATDGDTPKFEPGPAAPAAKTAGAGTLKIEVKDGQIIATFGDHTIEEFTTIAENGGKLAAKG